MFKGDLELDLEGELKGDSEVDFRGDLKQDLEGDLLSSSGQVWSRSGSVKALFSAFSNPEYIPYSIFGQNLQVSPTLI